jgi:hypothetical protein
MRLGSAKDAASTLLVAMGALMVLGSVVSPLTQGQWSLPNVIIAFVFGIALWRAGRLIGQGHLYGFHLAIASLVLLLVQPYLRGRTLSAVGTIILLGLLGLVIVAWRRTRGVPDA